MFGLLNSSQIYGLQHELTHEKSSITALGASTAATPTASAHKQRRSSSSVSDTTKEQQQQQTSKFLATLTSASQGMKSPTNFIEKFIKSELLNGYDTIKNYKNFHQQTTNKTNSVGGGVGVVGGGGSGAAHSAGVVSSFNCLHGNYRSSAESEFYEPINVSNECEQSLKSNKKTTTPNQGNAQRLSDSELDQPSSLLNSSGASSGEFNSSSDSTSTTTTTHTATANSNCNGLSKKTTQNGNSTLAVKNRNVNNGNTNEIASDNSSSSISTTTNTSTSSTVTSNKSTDHSSALRERKKSTSMTMANRSSPERNPAATAADGGASPTGDLREQRRKLMKVIANYDQENSLLQLELAKEKRRRNEELACVVKSLLCFEGKLKADMKSVNERLMEKDAEICRLVRQNRALRKQLRAMRDVDGDNTKDEGVEEDGGTMDGADDFPLLNLDAADECLVPEALQCINCRKQFYDIESKEGWTQSGDEVPRNNDEPTTEHGSSSDDTVSSSFYGARRSIRYTSKRTTGTFRDYMRSRSMHIDDDDDDERPSSQQGANCEQSHSTTNASRSNSQRSYEKTNLFSRTIERMHGLKGEGEDENEGGRESRSASRASNKSSSSSKSGASLSSKSVAQLEEDDGIFSPTQDEDFEEDDAGRTELSYAAAGSRSKEFSEASPEQIYETSTDDWYASASDQEDATATTAPKAYGQNAVNPVLECVNQILLQQSMEEPLREGEAADSDHSKSSFSGAPKNVPPPPPPAVNDAGATAGLPRRSSLSRRHSSRSNSHSSDGQPSRSGTLTRKRVHFSTKNSMVHVPRNDDLEPDDDDALLPRGTASNHSLVHYNPLNYFAAHLKCQSPPSDPSADAAAPPTQRDSAEQLERLDALNYESIYSNEYEPIGSEHNSSNLYVDMELAVKQLPDGAGADGKLLQLHKLPPALPPKPANLLKFKKSLQQLDEMPDEHLQQDECAASTTTASEPDYCSISEVNESGGMRSVQIVADVHKPPPETETENESEPDVDLEAAAGTGTVAELQLRLTTSLRSEEAGAETHKTEDIEEILADIPKLPNVAAIIAPKQSPKYRADVQPAADHYLLMCPKLETSTPNHKRTTASQMLLNCAGDKDFLLATSRSPKKADALSAEAALAGRSQHKRKHVPNILAELNKRMYNNGSASAASPAKATLLPSPKKAPSLLLNSPHTPPSLPLLQAEFDWYNLDAEYGKSPSSSSVSSATTPDILKGSDALGGGGGGGMLEEIHEVHESVAASADEYNLDEEFSLTCDRPDLVLGDQKQESTPKELPKMDTTLSSICEGSNCPLFSEAAPQPAPPKHVHAKKMKKNLENFEKFIECSGLSTKTVPIKRKIYFAGPFV